MFDTMLTESSHPSPSVQARHVCEHVINPEVFQDIFLESVYEKYAPTSRNMEATGGDPKVLDMETSCVFFFQFWIRRQQYQTRQRVAEIHATLDEI